MDHRDPVTLDGHPSAHGKVSDRNLADLKRHYDVERALGDRLRTLPAAERRAMYGEIYNELFARVPDHPQLTRKVAPERQRQKTAAEFRLIRKFITSDSTFLEIGAGDGAVSLRVAEDVKSVTALDVSDIILKNVVAPSNVRLLVFDGCEIPLEPGSVDVAYSNQVIEHLHPEDARLQMSSLLRTLKPGGCYVCVTPNRLNGPHDISMFFDTVATGLHMKEYTYREMDRFFRSLGFDRTGACLGIKGRFAVLPVWCAGVLESALSILPARLRMSIGRTPLFEKLLFIRFVAYKPR
jgi:SAM-dependent methyltransferase